jgi:integrase
VDLTHACLRLPDSKTGAKTIALSAAALHVLANLERRSDWVFPTQRGDWPVDLSRPWDRIRERAKLPRLRIHDLRHSHASVLATDGVPLLVIGRILGHKAPATTARYAHLADDPVRKAVEAAGDRIAAALSDAADRRSHAIDGASAPDASS